MFVAIVDVSLKEEKIPEFKTWITETNNVLSKFDGFVSRRLLEGEDGSKRIMVEFENIDFRGGSGASFGVIGGQHIEVSNCSLGHSSVSGALVIEYHNEGSRRTCIDISFIIILVSINLKCHVNQMY